jgi:DNA-binding response OmpR family regulator
MEDNPGLARLLQKILQRRGFVIDIATNGQEGLAMLDASNYDLLLLDYNMPFLGGIEVIRALTAKNSLPPTIMITGEGMNWWPSRPSNWAPRITSSRTRT